MSGTPGKTQIFKSNTHISYLILGLALLLMAWLKLGLFLLATLFGYLVLQKLSFKRSRLLSVALYLVLVTVLVGGLVYSLNLAYRVLPKIVETSVPAMTAFAERHGIQLPFSDYASLRSTVLDEAREGLTVIGRFARLASIQFVLLIAGLVVAVGIYLNPGWTARRGEYLRPESAYAGVTRQVSIRFSRLYQSFAKVMGAQISISAINTGLTAAFLASNSYPYVVLLIVLVFLCGMLPIVGNILSNSLLVGVGFTLSPRTGLLALVFLILIHKLEYFLNSKIVGKRIDSPMWLTLIGLVVGERLMGVTGMILAPVLLHFIKVEGTAGGVASDGVEGASPVAAEPEVLSPTKV